MPSTTSFEFGDIVLVSFPFTNQSGQKKRPAVVVSSHAYNQARPDLVLMAVTSQLHPPTNFGETGLTDWRAAGLLKPSAVKPVIFTVEKNLILSILGQLKEGDRQALQKTMAGILGQHTGS